MYRIALIILFSFCADLVTAQLSFPAGKTLLLETNKESLYNETGIFFHTGTNKITDYKWTHLFRDSLDPRWDFQACMNGDCKVGFPLTGPFIKDFGLNDTTGFIKVHILTFGFTGVSKWYYAVEHKQDTADRAILEFIVSYTNTTGVKEECDKSIGFYPNPVKEQLIITNPDQISGNISIVSSEGRTISSTPLTREKAQLLMTRDFSNGVYILIITTGHTVSRQPFVVSN